MTPTKAQLKVLVDIYMGTDCCNCVYDYATLHWKQQKIADQMPELVKWIDGVLAVDGDGFSKIPERYGRGFRLTPKGYEALTESNPTGFPPDLRRFYQAEAQP